MRTAVRFFLGKVRQKGRNLRHLVIVGCGPRGLFLGAEIRKRSELGYHLLGFIDDIAPSGPAACQGETHLGSLWADSDFGLLGSARPHLGD
jgi:hypothetical protein